jgi:hypothetical protein
MFTQSEPGFKALEQDKALEGLFKHPPVTGEVSGSNYLGLPSEITLTNDALEAPEVDTEAEAPEATEVENETEETTDEGSSDFAVQFKENFGIEPAEAIELVNSLQAFRDEVVLMGEWEVTPTEYRQRITKVKEFYNGLPEDGKPQFNTVEGAIAIWNHIQGNAPQKQQTKLKATSKVTKQVTNKHLFTRSQINAMDKDTYNKNIGAINRAFLQGLLLEDV